MLRANLSKLKKGIIRIFRKDCFDPRTKEQYEEFINKEKAAKKEPAKEKGNCEEERRSFYGLNLKHRTIENWGESRAY